MHARAPLTTITALAATGLLAVALTGCGSSSSKATTPATTPAGTGSSSSSVSAAAALLPAQFKSGVSVASDESYAPIDFFASGDTITGFDYDLGQALGTDLGTKFTFTNVGFDGIIPALQAKKYDVVMSAMSDNKTREATLTFVDYYTAGTSFVVKKGNPSGLTTLDALCGKHVAIEKGTTQQDVVTTQSTACTKAGKPAITIDALPTDSAALLEVESGKAVADLNDSPVASYIAEQSGGKYDSVLISSLGTSPYGIGVLNANSALATAIQAALKDVVANGTYAKILAKYGIAGGSLTTATINGATS